ncbi:MAG: CARDB domain-containing protein [Candidatus Cloacimonetes bacterium]|nr:CARDB domain-containing protein [Candidatus Cloacimonadota bacterium]
MKPFLFVLILLCALAGLFAQTTYTWTGSTSQNWSTSGNWSPNGVPTSADGVIIPATTNKPHITAASYCNGMIIQTGGELRLLSTFSLTNGGYLSNNGTLTMSSSGGMSIASNLDNYGVISVTGTGQLTVNGTAYWHSGSSIVDNGLTQFNFYGNLYIYSGSGFVMDGGGSVSFKGSSDSQIYNYAASTEFGYLNAAKNIGTGYVNINLNTTQPFKVNNNLVNNSGNRFFCSKDITVTLLGNLLDYNLGDTGGTYGFKWNAGSLKLDGAFQYIDLQGPGSYLRNLVCSATEGVVTEYELDLRGNLTIESGYLSVDGVNIILISGNWDNQVGPDGFIEGAGRVIFNNSSTWQYILSDETFNILEIDMFSALRFTSGKTVTCAQYDWTSGGIDMNTNATFTANDLADAGIYGKWWLTDQYGAINVTNENVDLKGDITISNGYFEVYSPADYSTWSSYDDASLVMVGGYLDFHQTGIAVYNVLGSPAPTYLTLSISSGYIRTEGDFEGTWSGFAPTGGIFVFYGSSNSLIDMPLGSFHNLTISKTSATATLWGNDFDLGGWLYVYNGTLDATGIQINCTMAMISAQLIMNTKLDSAGDIKWFDDSQLTAANNSIIECGGDWIVEAGANVQINSTVAVYLTSTGPQEFQINESSHTLGQLNIGEDSTGATYTGGTYTVSATSTADLNVPGVFDIRAGNTLDLNQRGMSVGFELRLWGTLIIGSGTATVNGSLIMSGVAAINIDSGTLYLVNRQFDVPTGAVVTLATGTVKCDGFDLDGTFQPAGGTVHLYSTNATNKVLTIASGNWLPDLRVDASLKTYHLGNDVTIKGDFILDWGQFSVQHPTTGTVYTMYVADNWWNNQGPSNFVESTGLVVFNGPDFQSIKTSENFNIIEINKTGPGGDALRIESGYPDLDITVNCNQYDWTAGALDLLQRCTFNANDLADNGIHGKYFCNDTCTLNLTDDTGVNLFGEMHVFGGEVNVYCTNAAALYSYWPAAATAAIEMSDGYLNFHDQGIWLQNGYALAVDITDGFICTAGNLVGRRDYFAPAGGGFMMIGSTNTTIDIDYDTISFAYLTINKDIPSATVELISGASIPLICRGNFTVYHGTFHMNREDLRCYGSLGIHNGGKMSFASYNYVRLAANQILSVNEGGMIDVYGSSDGQETLFTRISDGYYHFNVNDGGNLTAQHVIFEYMNTNGVYIQPGATVGALHHCTFRYGIPGGVLFRLDNDQDLTVTYANFPHDAGSNANNVYKMVDQGSVSFTDYSGVFSGYINEWDNYYRIFWLGTDMDLEILIAGVYRPDSYVCAPLTVNVQVKNNGTNDIVNPFRVDLYKNSPTAPPPGTLGDIFMEIGHLDAQHVKVINFLNVSTDVAESWALWARLDTDGQIPETDETDNLWGPQNLVWHALPAVTDISVAPGAYPNYLTVSWDYMGPFDRFRVYNSDDPFSFVNSTTTTGFSRSYNAATDPSHFFRVTVERDLPTP